MQYFRLIRWTNLVIIFCTQLLAWRCVIYPLSNDGIRLLLGFPNFLLLSFSTILIAGAGYIINDYFDVRIDSINKPDKMILERKIPRRLAIILHTTMNMGGLVLVGWVALQAGKTQWVLVQLSCTLLLWFYSTHFKRQFMIGNIVVALLTGLTILTLIVYEPALHLYLMQPAFVAAGTSTLPNPVWVLLVYAYFAFVLTWMREIVKDMEDFKGDEAEGCITMPIKWGLKKATRFTLLLAAFALLPISFGTLKLLHNADYLFAVYCFAGLVLPLVSWMIYLPKAATTKHFAKASRYLKMIMVLGLCSLFFYYLQANV
ncbi:MAG: geranylgeranylglycerol-phosphate geranylgeranyltransferase [Bacteroidetes bacterium]|nr:geranylgeranylglycerol-phosphate geranylgeranyltransferase [Bacteroidota bacterium]